MVAYIVYGLVPFLWIYQRANLMITFDQSKPARSIFSFTPKVHVAMTITVSDETFVGDIIHRITLDFERERVTVAQIISERVRQEVANYNDRLPEFFHALIVPSGAEKTVQGLTMRSMKRVDAEVQVGLALKAFCANGFFVLIDNRQAESLEQEVLLNEETVVTFIKLTPLVGG